MAKITTSGTPLLDYFLKIMVFALIGILIIIPLCILLDQLGIFEALGWFG